MTEFPQNLSLILQTLDIALAAFVIYRLSLLINDALAVRILASLSLLLVFSMAARLAGLHTVHLLLQAVIASSFVALVVIFQTDIRLRSLP